MVENWGLHGRVDTPNTDLTVTNVDSLKETPVVDSRGSYEMTLPQGTNIPANGYLGLKFRPTP